MSKADLSDSKYLILAGFQASHVVLRIDPISNPKMYLEATGRSFCDDLDVMINFAYENGISRIRYSYMDIYNHVLSRFDECGIKTIEAICYDEIILVSSDKDYYQ